MIAKSRNRGHVAVLFFVCLLSVATTLIASGNQTQNKGMPIKYQKPIVTILPPLVPPLLSNIPPHASHDSTTRLIEIVLRIFYQFTIQRSEALITDNDLWEPYYRDILLEWKDHYPEMAKAVQPLIDLIIKKERPRDHAKMMQEYVNILRQIKASDHLIGEAEAYRHALKKTEGESLSAYAKLAEQYKKELKSHPSSPNFAETLDSLIQASSLLPKLMKGSPDQIQKARDSVIEHYLSHLNAYQQQFKRVKDPSPDAKSSLLNTVRLASKVLGQELPPHSVPGCPVDLNPSQRGLSSSSEPNSSQSKAIKPASPVIHPNSRIDLKVGVKAQPFSIPLSDLMNFARMVDPAEPIGELNVLKNQIQSHRADPKMQERTRKELKILSDYQVETKQSLRELVANAIDSNYHSDFQKSETLPVVNIKAGAELTQDGKGQVTVTDRGIGMTLDDIVKYLLTPHRSKNKMIIDPSKASAGVTGRFGQGFFSNLGLLKKEGDSIKITTRHHTPGSPCIELTLRWTGNEYVSDFRELEGGRHPVCESHGSEFHITSSLLAGQGGKPDPVHSILDAAVSQKFQFNKKADVKIDGISIQSKRPTPQAQIEGLNGARISTIGEPQPSGPGKVSVVVNGVVIQDIIIDGLNIYPEMVIELPEDTPLTPDRSTLDFHSQKSKEVFINLFDKANSHPDSNHTSLVNSLYLFLKTHKPDASNVLDDWLPRERHKGILPAIGSLKFLDSVKYQNQAALIKRDFMSLVHPDLFEIVADSSDLQKRLGDNSVSFIPVKLKSPHRLERPIETYRVGTRVYALVNDSVPVNNPMLRRTLEAQSADIARLNRSLGEDWNISSQPHCFKEDEASSFSISDLFQHCENELNKAIDKEIAESPFSQSTEQIERYRAKRLAKFKTTKSALKEFLSVFRLGETLSGDLAKEVHHLVADGLLIDGFYFGERNPVHFRNLTHFFKDYPSISFSDFLDVYHRFKALFPKCIGDYSTGEAIALVLTSERIVQPPRAFSSAHLDKTFRNGRFPALSENARSHYFRPEFVKLYLENPTIDRGRTLPELESTLCQLKFATPKATDNFYHHCLKMIYQFSMDFEGPLGFVDSRQLGEIMSQIPSESRFPSVGAAGEYLKHWIDNDKTPFKPYIQALFNRTSTTRKDSAVISFDFPTVLEEIENNSTVRRIIGRDKDLIKKEYQLAFEQNPNPYAWVYEMMKNSNEAGADHFKVDLGRDKENHFVLKLADNGSGVATNQMSAFYIPNITTKVKESGDINFGWGFFTLFKYFDEVVVESKVPGTTEKSILYLSKTPTGLKIREEKKIDRSFPQGTQIRGRRNQVLTELELAKINQEFDAKRDVFKGEVEINGSVKAKDQKQILRQSGFQLRSAPHEKADIQLVAGGNNPFQVLYNGSVLGGHDIASFFPELKTEKQKSKFYEQLGPIRIDLENASFSQNAGRSDFIRSKEVYSELSVPIRQFVLDHLSSKLKRPDASTIDSHEVLSTLGYDFYYEPDHIRFRHFEDEAEKLSSKYRKPDDLIELFDTTDSSAKNLTLFKLSQPIHLLGTYPNKMNYFDLCRWVKSKQPNQSMDKPKVDILNELVTERQLPAEFKVMLNQLLLPITDSISSHGRQALRMAKSFKSAGGQPLQETERVPGTNRRDLLEMVKKLPMTAGQTPQDIVDCVMFLQSMLVEVAQGQLGISLSLDFFGSPRPVSAEAQQGQAGLSRVISINLHSSDFKNFFSEWKTRDIKPIPESTRAEWYNLLSHELTHTYERTGQDTHNLDFFNQQQRIIFQLIDSK